MVASEGTVPMLAALDNRLAQVNDTVVFVGAEIAVSFERVNHRKHVVNLIILQISLIVDLGEVGEFGAHIDDKSVLVHRFTPLLLDALQNLFNLLSKGCCCAVV